MIVEYAQRRHVERTTASYTVGVGSTSGRKKPRLKGPSTMTPWQTDVFDHFRNFIRFCIWACAAVCRLAGIGVFDLLDLPIL